MPIANFFISKILKAYRDLNYYDEDDVDVIRFGLEASLWEIEKLVYIAVIFVVLGQWLKFLACIVAVLTIRPMTGGFHASTAWRCFWWTLFGFALAIVALPLLITLNDALIIFLGVFSIVSTAIAAPTRSEQMERIANKDNDKLKKTIAISITAIWFIVLFINQAHFLAPIVIWAIFLQNLQLIITWVMRRKKSRILSDER